MTSTTGTTQHPDVSEISDLTEGLLSPSRQAAVRVHLDSCALCTDVRTSLEEIRGLLGTLPGAQRMPADIAGRIDAALAAEALLNATAPEEAAEEPGDVSRETSLVPQQPETAPSDRPAGRPRAATGPGRGQTRRRRRTVMGAVLGAAAVGVGVLLLQAVGVGGGGPVSQTADKTVSSAQGGPEFSEAGLQARVQTLLAAGTSKDGSQKAPRVEEGPSIGIESSPNSPMRTPAVPVPPCVQQGTGRTENAVAVEQGSYAGTKAYLLVLPHAHDPSQVQAYVVDAACVNTTPQGKGELLLTHSYPRR
ncbi:zf-HC2 domain-containing protein [Streptomyces sp. NPDC000410]|uniref:zf-HC2 domain-containing protein n=1 Tax=Streptomyces sp. NPDC000410 TaxID=3154254 RepID=UPI003326615A